MEPTFLVLFLIYGLFLSMTVFSIVKATYTLGMEDKDRIIDLFVIGIILYSFGFIPNFNYSLFQQLALAGSLIFVYLSVVRGRSFFGISNRGRLIDLFVIGVIIYLVDSIHPFSYSVDGFMLFSGSLIFTYGFIILLYKKFLEGYHESIGTGYSR